MRWPGLRHLSRTAVRIAQGIASGRALDACGNRESHVDLRASETGCHLGDFAELSKDSKFRASWMDAITSVVTSSLQGQLEIDNSQVIVSNDERHTFRVILTAGTRYFSGVRIHPVFCGISAASRFRRSLHDSRAEGAGAVLSLPVLVSGKEQRILTHEHSHRAPDHISCARSEHRARIEFAPPGCHRDGTGQTQYMGRFVDWAHLQKMSEEWRPLEVQIKDC